MATEEDRLRELCEDNSFKIALVESSFPNCTDEYCTRETRNDCFLVGGSGTSRTLYCRPYAFDLDDCLWHFVDRNYPDCIKLMEARVYRDHSLSNIGAVLDHLRGVFPGPMAAAIESLNQRTDLCDQERGIDQQKLKQSPFNIGCAALLFHVLYRCGRTTEDQSYLYQLRKSIIKTIKQNHQNDAWMRSWCDSQCRAFWRYEDRIIRPFFQSLCANRPHTEMEALLFRCLTCENFLTPLTDEFSLEMLAKSKEYGGEAAKILSSSIANLRKLGRMMTSGAVLTDAEALGVARVCYSNNGTRALLTDYNPKLVALSAIVSGEKAVIPAEDMARFIKYRKSLNSLSATPGANMDRPADDSTMCAICIVVAAEFAFIPCGHRCLCQKCATDASVNKAICLVCRQHVEKVVRIF